MTFKQAIRTVWSKYAIFSGRAARPEYWWWALFVLLVTTGTGLIDHFVLAPRMGVAPFSRETPEVLSMIVSLGLLLPGLAVSVRRLHDLDKSGWWLLIVLIPIIGVLVLLYWFVSRGTQGTNRFGPEPTKEAAY